MSFYCDIHFSAPYSLSLHDALPISSLRLPAKARIRGCPSVIVATLAPTPDRNDPNRNALTPPSDSSTIAPPGSGQANSANGRVRAMTWEPPAFIDVKIESEINSYHPAAY